MKTLKGRRVLVTGAGHGLGLEIARSFAREGAVVLVSDRDPRRVDDAVAALLSESLQVAGYVMDVADINSVRAVRDMIHSEHGPVHVIVNNAGIVTGGQFLDVPVERHVATFAVNTHGPVFVTHAFLPDLLEQAEGHIVNIASASALIPLPRAATYAASKWALLGFTDSLREELLQSGCEHVGVTAICPSYIATGMFTGVRVPLLTRLLSPEWVARKVVRCVRRKREMLIAPFLVSLIPLAKVTWPRALFRWFLTCIGVYESMAEWRGHQPPKREAPAASGVERSRDMVRHAS